MSNLNDLLVVMREHQKADRLIQGYWIENKNESEGILRGCFYGCAMQTDKEPIKAACNKYGMPLWIGYWSERVFEVLPANEAAIWPVQLLEPLVNFTGDYEYLRHKLAIKRLSYLSERNARDVKKSIDDVIKYHQTRDENIRKSVVASAWPAPLSASWSAEWSAGLSAAWSAAWPAPLSASWSAPLSAAWSAEWSAQSVAGSVGELSRSVEESAAWQRERDWMLELLKEQTR